MIQESQSKCQQLVETLSRLIDEGAYQPHQRFFSVEKIKQRFGVSQATVTETLNRLEQDGRIYRKPNSGTFVSPPQRIKQILVVARFGPGGSEAVNSFVYNLQCGIACRPHYFVSSMSEEEFLEDFKHVDIVYRNVETVVFFRLADRFEQVRGRLESLGIRAVFYGSTTYREQIGDRNCYYYDEKSVARTGLDHLYDAGHRKIGCIHLTESTLFEFRKQQYIEWMIERGLYINNHALIGRPTLEFGAVHRALEEADLARLDCTALFCVHYGPAIEAVQALVRRGVRIPDDIAVISVGWTSAFRFCFPLLTTVDIDHNGDAHRIGAMLAAASRDLGREITGWSPVRVTARQTV